MTATRTNASHNTRRVSSELAETARNGSASETKEDRKLRLHRESQARSKARELAGLGLIRSLEYDQQTTDIMRDFGTLPERGCTDDEVGRGLLASVREIGDLLRIKEFRELLTEHRRRR